MKKFILASLAFVAISLQSCKKHEHEGTVSYQTININLEANKNYQYSFGVKSDVSITKQSQEFLVSEIDNSNESKFFSYTPKFNFVGIDEVQITVYQEELKHHHGKGGHHGNCNSQSHGMSGHECHKHDDDDDKTIYTFKFNIKQTTLTTKVSSSTAEVAF